MECSHPISNMKLVGLLDVISHGVDKSGKVISTVHGDFLGGNMVPVFDVAPSHL
jgi:hypothetical protein